MQGCWDILFYPLFKEPQTGLTLMQNVNLNSQQTSHGIKQVFSSISERKRGCGVFWVDSALCWKCSHWMCLSLGLQSYRQNWSCVSPLAGKIILMGLTTQGQDRFGPGCVTLVSINAASIPNWRNQNSVADISRIEFPVSH